ncbi:hypothetical protein PR003_g25315 [Phytophthora rubi]|uniref:RxLR effector protein n=1 Tax=Phytophthora rubi TaxID=129364 RepID=A0A6A3H1L0_9STRA|nr:hypothetical protein PR001_g29399 [Phytophthora rubi]KAE9290347.1 hypothetical protein PR003_g25315 [Phytophthora rubi]
MLLRFALSQKLLLFCCLSRCSPAIAKFDLRCHSLTSPTEVQNNRSNHTTNT